MVLEKERFIRRLNSATQFAECYSMFHNERCGSSTVPRNRRKLVRVAGLNSESVDAETYIAEESNVNLNAEPYDW